MSVKMIKGIGVALMGWMLAGSLLAADTDSHFEVALQSVIVPQGAALEQMVNGLVQAQLKANPDQLLLENAFKQFYREMLTSSEYKARLARVQMQYFSEAELHDLVELMQQPIFIKYQRVMPALMPQLMEVGIAHAQANKDRLIELIEAERSRREAEIISSAGYKNLPPASQSSQHPSAQQPLTQP